jgi:hypothetical protein
VDSNLGSDSLSVALEPLLARFATLLARELAPCLTAELALQQPAPSSARRLLTLNELIELLPAGKKPTTWKPWLYQRTRLGQVPGCHKIGNRLFFNPDLTLPWLTNPAETGHTAAGLDVPAIQSHDAPPMHTQPVTRRQGG